MLSRDVSHVADAPYYDYSLISVRLTNTPSGGNDILSQYSLSKYMMGGNHLAQVATPVYNPANRRANPAQHMTVAEFKKKWRRYQGKETCASCPATAHLGVDAPSRAL